MKINSALAKRCIIQLIKRVVRSELLTYPVRGLNFEIPI